MKPKQLARRCHVLTVDSPEQIERMLAGDFLLVQPKARTKSATRMRKLRAERRDAGWLLLELWADPEQVAAISSALRPGETYLDLLLRLLDEQRGSLL